LPSRLVEHAEGRHGFSAVVAEQRVIDFSEVCKRFLGVGCVDADAQHFGVLRLELGIIVRTGRLQILDSGRTEIENVKIDQDILPLEAAQFQFAAFGAV